MKNILFTLLLAISCATLVSCTQMVFNPHHARSESLWKTQPRINEKESPATAKLDSVDAKVFSNAVFLNARSGSVKPIEIRVFDQFGNDGVFDTVYIREGPPKSTLVYHNPKLDPGTWIEEGAELDPAKGEQYLALAETARRQAKNSIPSQKPSAAPKAKPAPAKEPNPYDFEYIPESRVQASSIDMSGKTEYTEYTTGEPGTHGGRDAALEKLERKAKRVILD